MASFPYVNVTSAQDYSASQYFGFLPYTVYLIDASANDVPITLCDATLGSDGQMFIFKRKDASGTGTHSATLNAYSGQNISGSATLSIPNNTVTWVLASNSNWTVI